MAKVAIVADSTAGLSAEYVREHEISVIPLYLHMQGNTLRDGVDITSDQFYERLSKCDPVPTTSQPSAGDFLTLYRRLVDEGATAIVSVHISSYLSGTVNSARLAAEQLEGVPVEIVDTLATVGGIQLPVEAGVAARAAGADLKGVAAAMQAVVEAQKVIFAVDTLEYLYKGGRIGGAAALLGSMLQLKPILRLLDGKIEAVERVRTSSKALVRMMALAGEWMGQDAVRVVVMDSACSERAQEVIEHLPKYLNVQSVASVAISPCIGTHTGPGTVGLTICPSALLEG
jgi:DegV family protein with EDD domain